MRPKELVLRIRNGPGSPYGPYGMVGEVGPTQLGGAQSEGA